MQKHRLTGLLALALSGACPAAELRQPTIDAFDGYIRTQEQRIDAQVHGPENGFLWSAASPERLRQLQAGGIAVESRTGKDALEVPGGLIHDWIGAVFVPGARLEQVLALVQDYNRHKEIYKPEVIGSRMLSHQGQDYRVYLRLLKKKVITVVLDTEHDVRYFPLSGVRCYSRSYSTRIAEVRDAGKPGESALPPGQGHGFLWRLDSYWRFLQKDGGVYVECEAISLTRDVPAGLGWLISPIVRNLPR